MEVNFKADKITCETHLEEGYYMIGFSDNGDEPNQYVILQKSIDFDEQDIELGLNSYYFEYSDQSNSEYDVCRNVVLEKDKITFILKEDFLEDITKIVIVFEEKTIQNPTEFESVFKKIIDDDRVLTLFEKT